MIQTNNIRAYAVAVCALKVKEQLVVATCLVYSNYVSITTHFEHGIVSGAYTLSRANNVTITKATLNETLITNKLSYRSDVGITILSYLSLVSILKLLNVNVVVVTKLSQCSSVVPTLSLQEVRSVRVTNLLLYTVIWAIESTGTSLVVIASLNLSVIITCGVALRTVSTGNADFSVVAKAILILESNVVTSFDLHRSSVSATFATILLNSYAVERSSSRTSSCRIVDQYVRCVLAFLGYGNGVKIVSSVSSVAQIDGRSVTHSVCCGLRNGSVVVATESVFRRLVLSHSQADAQYKGKCG